MFPSCLTISFVFFRVETHQQVIMAVRLGRLKKECQQLRESPPPGISCWPDGDELYTYSAGM